MTIGEALIIGCKEQGWTDEQISAARAMANLESPNTIPWDNEKIPEGREREFINAWKATAHLSKKDQRELREYCAKKIMEHDSKN